MNEVFRELAERNGWSYSISENRPYFMKNGNYAIPDETTSEEDKEQALKFLKDNNMETTMLVYTLLLRNTILLTL